jgi:3-oxoadipate enol-lactonase
VGELVAGYAKGPDGRLRFTRVGSGPALILLHPLALSGAVYEPLAAGLADRFDVIAVDLRGHGGSSWSGTPFSIPDLADDVVAVLDALQIGSASLVGMSMGGCVALATAAAYPDRINRLVLADTTAWYGPDAKDTWAERAIAAVEKPRPQQLPFQMQRWFTEAYATAYGEGAQSAASVFVATDSAVHSAACRALGVADLRLDLAGITAPTLVMTGAGDFATPVAMGRAIATGIPGAVFEELPDLKHLSLVERPDLAARIAAHLGLAVA